MSLRQRLRTVENRTASLHPELWCPTCGGPSRHGRAVVIFAPGEELPRCRSCNRELDKDGRTAGWLTPRGTLVLKRLVMDRDPSTIETEAEEQETRGP
jgi:hypothetical protein